MFSTTIKIRTSQEILLSEEAFRKRRQGEILHFAVSKIKTLNDIKHLRKFVLQALAFLGESPSLWNIERDFVQPLKNIFDLKEAKIFFSPKAREILCEAQILLPKGSYSSFVLKPDRIVIFEDKALVIDFKSTKGPIRLYQEYVVQMKNYIKVVKDLFNLPTEGYLFFIFDLKVETISEKEK